MNFYFKVKFNLSEFKKKSELVICQKTKANGIRACVHVLRLTMVEIRGSPTVSS